MGQITHELLISLNLMGDPLIPFAFELLINREPLHHHQGGVLEHSNDDMHC